MMGRGRLLQEEMFFDVLRTHFGIFFEKLQDLDAVIIGQSLEELDVFFVCISQLISSVPI